MATEKTNTKKEESSEMKEAKIRKYEVEINIKIDGEETCRFVYEEEMYGEEEKDKEHITAGLHDQIQEYITDIVKDQEEERWYDVKFMDGEEEHVEIGEDEEENKDGEWVFRCDPETLEGEWVYKKKEEGE